jgi:hypothetical protein
MWLLIKKLWRHYSVVFQDDDVQEGLFAVTMMAVVTFPYCVLFFWFFVSSWFKIISASLLFCAGCWYGIFFILSDFSIRWSKASNMAMAEIQEYRFRRNFSRQFDENGDHRVKAKNTR